ncbi:MAG: IS982 family transposase [Acidobacteriota bacterium]|nr:IS982 family transposase [Acidobacteriota bacterium]
MENQLIQLYLLVCQIYDNQSSLKSQRASNFKPRFTDEELVSCYLFGHLNGLFQKKAIYRFTRNYWADWFPELPSYQAFCNRLNNLESSFQIINRELLTSLVAVQVGEIDRLIDSFPVMLAKGAFARRARVAREVAAIGYCAAKRLHFHGVRLHLLAVRRAGCLPMPSEIWFRAGNVHDLTAFKEQNICLPNTALFGDKAFCDAALKKQLAEQNTRLFVPVKKPKGKDQSESGKQLSRLVSKFRQPIESFFKWLNDKTQIQTAGSVRSANGLLLHCFGKLTFALLLLVFYS